ncbi:hypothetical protein ACLKA6_004898 [Drosophila palustris]
MHKTRCACASTWSWSMANGKWPMAMSCSVPGATPCCGPDSEPNPRLVGGSSVDLLRPERQVRGPSFLCLSCSSPRCGNSSCLKGRAMSQSRQTVPGDICASNLRRMPPQQQQQQQPQHRQQRIVVRLPLPLQQQQLLPLLLLLHVPHVFVWAHKSPMMASVIVLGLDPTPR